MPIHIQGAAEHNLQNVDVNFPDGLTVVTGVSGSGKTSLVFDTLYHEARRRFLEIYALGSSDLRLSPARVDRIEGLGPAIAVGQNLLNRNPNSTLATASGMHPFLRLLYTNFGQRRCKHCGTELSVLSNDEILQRLVDFAAIRPVRVYASLLRHVPGSHRTLLASLSEHFDPNTIQVDGKPWQGNSLIPDQPHNLALELATFDRTATFDQLQQVLETASALGVHAFNVQSNDSFHTLSSAPVCAACGSWFEDLQPRHFHTSCYHCEGQGCQLCGDTGLFPSAAAVWLNRLRLPDLLKLNVDQSLSFFSDAALPSTAKRLYNEITRRLTALQRVGLGYLSLDRPSPTLSRGESQRVRLAVTLTSQLEDLLHVLDEPTIGQHPADVLRLMPALRALPGPVIFIEHDRIAAAQADYAVDLGPGAGEQGGRLLYSGSPADLWSAETPSGLFFSLRERVPIPAPRPAPQAFLTIHGTSMHNLQGFDLDIPLSRLTVVTGVSGSGKSTLVESVLHASLSQGEPVGCKALEAPTIKSVLVDQDPIGRNPRSNPATYTKLADIIRQAFAQASGLSASHFSFNRPEGACPTCRGMGAVEIKLRYLPSTWIPCSDCDGLRFSEQLLDTLVKFSDKQLSIADFYQLRIQEALPLLVGFEDLSPQKRSTARLILGALCDIGLGYLTLGQSSPTLSGGEAQRVKLAKFLGRRSLSKDLLILDEPTTGLHPADIARLLVVLDRLVRAGATIVVVEHNTDVIRAADWVIDLGPGAGPAGGQLLYAGPPAGLASAADSLTARALADEESLQPQKHPTSSTSRYASHIEVRKACANNLKEVDVDIPKGTITVVTGLSGSGKSSLVVDILEAEARRRFLETLSLYERQSTKEGPEAAVDSVSGLGVTLAITPQPRHYNLRASVGSATELAHHLAVLFSTSGQRCCLDCGTQMQRESQWRCPSCNATTPIAPPRHFSPYNYRAACQTCHGIGTLQVPQPDKLIIHPEKPLCAGAMYSPGFFPKGYLCEPFNGGYDMVQALAARYDFNPALTPWDQLSSQAQDAFLFGDAEPLQVRFTNRAGRSYTRQVKFPGFYGFIRDWDVGGTYTSTETCPHCNGKRLRPEFLAVTLAGQDIQQLSELPLAELYTILGNLDSGYNNKSDTQVPAYANITLQTALDRLRFLNQVGLGYLHLNRVAGTLSAGEAQRVQLAGLLGSGLASLTILLDEPSRGLHPSEVESLLGALQELRGAGNTVIVIEHDLQVIQSADQVIDMGPGAGVGGGQIVAQGSPAHLAEADSITGRWLLGKAKMPVPQTRRKPYDWMEIINPRANNLKGEIVRLPLDTLIGICGVSGSGKSTLMVDTVGRALAPRKHTTSVAYEPIEPGEHDAILNAPPQTILVDQTRRGISSPAAFLGLERPLRQHYAGSPQALTLEVSQEDLAKRCSVCHGRGFLRMEMGFLPDVRTPCETCQGTGLPPVAWEVTLDGLTLPQLYELTLDQVYPILKHDTRLEQPLRIAQDVGLGYLVLRQPAFSLSGGEVQRLKIVQQLCRPSTKGTLYILDEPSVGQHLEDLNLLLDVLNRLVHAGNTVVIVEHHPHLLVSCDWLVELGPGGGPQGGHLIAQGTPEQLAAGDTPISTYLREILSPPYLH